MKKDTIDLQVAAQDTMRVEAYLSSTPGLAIHRQVVYVPGKEEHKFTSKWQVSHVESGTALLKPSECPSTMALAERLARYLNSYDWSQPLDALVSDESLKEDLEAALKKIREADPDPEEGETPISKRFVTRRNPDGPGYVVFDTEANKTIDTFLHRGLASEDAKKRNEQVST